MWYLYASVPFNGDGAKFVEVIWESVYKPVRCSVSMTFGLWLGKCLEGADASSRRRCFSVLRFMFLFLIILCQMEYSSILGLIILHKVSPWRRIPYDKLVVARLIKKFTAFCGTRTVISDITTDSHFSLFLDELIQSTPSYPVYLAYFLILLFYLRLRLPPGLSPSGFPPPPQR